ncbi:hypothetical protein BGX29_009359, partial [Mortierella sp. GBA35]
TTPAPAPVKKALHTVTPCPISSSTYQHLDAFYYPSAKSTSPTRNSARNPFYSAIRHAQNQEIYNPKQGRRRPHLSYPCSHDCSRIRHNVLVASLSRNQRTKCTADKDDQLTLVVPVTKLDPVPLDKQTVYSLLTEASACHLGAVLD